ncbi:MAG TPA: L,D-transpeptidase family protein [Polyangiaceae bacterium]|jgi:hypothetical protein|nr:L,D-transpeptidase family protein [Polyangiaceae bacterium]
MARFSGALLVALAAASCSSPGSLFSVPGREFAVPAARVEAVEVPQLAAPRAVETPRVTDVVAAAPDIEETSVGARTDVPATATAPGSPVTVVAPASAEDVPAATEETLAPEADPDVLVATAKETLVFARPSFKAPKLGYLRAGAVVHRSASPAGFDGCRGGFYEVAPEGYVCAGNNASLDAKSELVRAAPRRADRTATMPYEYGAAAGAGAPLYSRIPTANDEHAAEPGLGARRGVAPSFDGLTFDDVPWFLANRGSSISTSGSRFSAGRAVLGNAIAKSAFAFVSLFEAGGRRFGLTADMAVVPLDRLSHVVPSRFHGLPLGDDAALPVVFVRSQAAALYSGDPLKGLKFERRLEFREALPITGKRVRAGSLSYLETRSGEFIVDQGLVRVDPPTTLPPWATKERSWIDVSIDRQALVAYLGPRPVFVTLVSTGVDGKGDPETTHSTIQGEFLIHTKHVTITMDGDEVGDEFDLRDVPYVQYFKEGFAFHAAYWHDGFGTPRSHGCVNLSPLDARWLFAWTLPSVPVAWHGAMSARGTLVSIHP